MNTWTIYSAQDTRVIATRWAEDGTHVADAVVVDDFDTPEYAVQAARQLQESYNRLRTTLEAQ